MVAGLSNSHHRIDNRFPVADVLGPASFLSPVPGVPTGTTSQPANADITPMVTACLIPGPVHRKQHKPRADLPYLVTDSGFCPLKPDAGNSPGLLRPGSGPTFGGGPGPGLYYFGPFQELTHHQQ